MAKGARDEPENRELILSDKTIYSEITADHDQKSGNSVEKVGIQKYVAH